MDDWQRRVMKQMPLAEATMVAFRYVMDDDFLTGVFKRHRGASYQDVLTFDNLVRLLTEALVEHAGSGRQAFLRAQERDELGVSHAAAYGKLRRIPQSLSHGFLEESTARLMAILPSAPSPIPRSLRRFAVVAIDGKKIKRAAKRLMPTRKFRGSVLGGKALVAMCVQTGLAIAMHSDLDGEANDPPLLSDLLAQIRSRECDRPRLYVLDRGFSDLKAPALLCEGGDQFVIRQHVKLSFAPDLNEKVRTGKDGHGRRYVEEWGWIGREKDNRRRYVRRITLRRGPGEEDVLVFTSLLDGDRHPAVEVLELYRQRWGIERVFQQITEVFHLQHLIASTPQGTIFQCALCFVLYNLIQVIRAYAAQGQDVDPETVSAENLFYDARRELVAWDVLLGTSWTLHYFRDRLTPSVVTSRLAVLARRAWTPRWTKATKRNNLKPKPKPKPITPGGHTSIQRLIQKHLRP